MPALGRAFFVQFILPLSIVNLYSLRIPLASGDVLKFFVFASPSLGPFFVRVAFSLPPETSFFFVDARCLFFATTSGCFYFIVFFLKKLPQFWLAMLFPLDPPSTVLVMVLLSNFSHNVP